MAVPRAAKIRQFSAPNLLGGELSLREARVCLTLWGGSWRFDRVAPRRPVFSGFLVNSRWSGRWHYVTLHTRGRPSAPSGSARTRPRQTMRCARPCASALDHISRPSAARAYSSSFGEERSGRWRRYGPRLSSAARNGRPCWRFLACVMLYPTADVPATRRPRPFPPKPRPGPT